MDKEREGGRLPVAASPITTPDGDGCLKVGPAVDVVDDDDDAGGKAISEGAVGRPRS